MRDSLSQNTKAILLLTARLIVGRAASREADTRPLSLKREYAPLARRLREIEREPADLLGIDAGSVLDECMEPLGPRIDRRRIENLLGRGLQLSLAVERWRKRAIWILSRADAGYPRRLKRVLLDDAPPVLFGCGDRSFLDEGGLAIVGPRAAADGLLGYARAVGELAAEADRTVISGGARGVDREAMSAALEARGRALGVLANGLAGAATLRENREALMDGRLALVSPYDPAAPFVVGHAMERNRILYALADASLVVDALVGRGGTWSGAAAQLRGCPACPVYVRSTLGHSEGLAALEDRGARPWPNPYAPEALGGVLDGGAGGTALPAAGKQRPLVAAPESSILAAPRQLPLIEQSDDSEGERSTDNQG